MRDGSKIKSSLFSVCFSAAAEVHDDDDDDVYFVIIHTAEFLPPLRYERARLVLKNKPQHRFEGVFRVPGLRVPEHGPA